MGSADHPFRDHPFLPTFLGHQPPLHQPVLHHAPGQELQEVQEALYIQQLLWAIAEDVQNHTYQPGQGIRQVLPAVTLQRIVNWLKSRRAQVQEQLVENQRTERYLLNWEQRCRWEQRWSLCERKHGYQRLLRLIGQLQRVLAVRMRSQTGSRG